jgi:ribonuclease PH
MRPLRNDSKNMKGKIMRIDKREYDELRPIIIIPHYTKGPYGSVMIETGDTRVLCTASLEMKVPFFLKDSNQGWLTAEYGMLPGSGNTRISREAARGKVSGRTAEIQRLIGRSLRSAVDMAFFPNMTMQIDCDVIQADGGTRTASITGAFVALKMAFECMLKEKKIKKNPLLDYVAATSVGIVKGKALLDLCYEEDFRADVDMNLVMTGRGQFIEIQGTAEESSFSDAELQKMLSLGRKGIIDLIKAQKRIFEG